MSLDRLRKTAEAATPGEWTADGMEVYGPHLDWVAETWDRVDKERGRANARHVATFDPPTVLAALDVISAASEATDLGHGTSELAAALTRFREVIGDV